MPVTYTRDDVRRVITVVMTGQVTSDEIIAVVDRQVAEQAWSYGLLYDSLQTTLNPANVEPVALHIRAAAQRLGRRGPVAVVTRSPGTFRIARAYAAVEDDVGPVGFFTDRDSAERWLEHPDLKQS
jgi:hypothetical protein